MKELVLPEGWPKKLIVVDDNMESIFEYFYDLYSEEELLLEFGEEIEPIVNRVGHFSIRGSYSWFEGLGRAWLSKSSFNHKEHIKTYLIPIISRKEYEALSSLQRVNRKLLSRRQEELVYAFWHEQARERLKSSLFWFKALKEDTSEASSESNHSNS